jgi:hypothetical protein
MVFKGGDESRGGYRDMCKAPRGFNVQLETGGLKYGAVHCTVHGTISEQFS